MSTTQLVSTASYCHKQKYTPKDQFHVNKYIKKIWGVGGDTAAETKNYYYTSTIKSTSLGSGGRERNQNIEFCSFQ